MFPDTSFRMIDGTGKKIRVVNEVAQSLGLKNVDAVHLRGEEEKGKYDFVVSRAVMPLPDLMKIIRKNFSGEQRNSLPNGLLCLKGGNIEAEMHPYRRIAEAVEITNWFGEDWFKDKYVIYVPAT